MLGLGALIGGGIGALSGLGSAISGNSKEKDAINRARDINKYSALTGKSVQEPGRTQGGFWSGLTKTLGGAALGAKTGSSIEKGFNDIKKIQEETAKIEAATNALKKGKKGVSAVKKIGDVAAVATPKLLNDAQANLDMSLLEADQSNPQYIKNGAFPVMHESRIDPNTLEETGGYSKQWVPWSPTPEKPKQFSWGDFLQNMGNKSQYYRR